MRARAAEWKGETVHGWTGAFPRTDNQVIVVTRLNGPPFAVNPDLVQRIDSAPDTILTLVDGTKYIVQESMYEVIELVNEHRSRMIARAQDIQRESEPTRGDGRPDLRSAPTLPADPHATPVDDDPAVRRDRQPELSLVKAVPEEDA